VYQRGHTGVNLLLYAPVSFLLVRREAFVLLVIGLIGFVGLSSFPDVDQRLPIKHRGWTHTVWFAALVGAAYAAFWWWIEPSSLPRRTVGAGAFVAGAGGILGHVTGDALTPMGVRPFAPLWRERFTIRLTKASSRGANAVLFALGGALWVGAVVVAGAPPSLVEDVLATV
jgi:inner membrane protein